MSIGLASGNIIYQQQEFELVPDVKYYSCTITENPSKQRRYFEFTHFRGMEYHMVGFNLGNGSISFYAMGNSSSPKVYTTDYHVSVNQGQYSNIPFSVSREHTVGIGIDTETSTFSVYYGQQVFNQQYTYDLIISSLKIQVWEASVSSAKDIISVNLGDHPFKYGAPIGFTAWYKTLKRVSCFNKAPFLSKQMKSILLLVVSSLLSK